MRRDPTTLRPRELADDAGVSTDTLRHYERLGLLAPPGRTPNGHRRYPAATRERVRVIRSALGVGFTLEELGRVLRTRDAGGVPCGVVRALAVERRREVDGRIAALRELRRELGRILRDWDRRLARSGPRSRAHLLDSLTTAPSSPIADGGCFALLGRRPGRPPRRSTR